MSPKGLYGKSLLSKKVLLEGDGTFKRQGLLGGLWVVRGVASERTVGPRPTLPLSFVLWPEVSSFAVLYVPVMMCCLTHSSRTNDHGLETLKP